jgi:hypothetical protein
MTPGQLRAPCAHRALRSVRSLPLHRFEVMKQALAHVIALSIGAAVLIGRARASSAGENGGSALSDPDARLTSQPAAIFRAIGALSGPNATVPGGQCRKCNGGRGIRTPKSLRTPVFKTGAIAILPALHARKIIARQRARNARALVSTSSPDPQIGRAAS